MSSKEEKLRDTLALLTDALGEYGCEFLNLEIDCPECNSEHLGRFLRAECACENIIWTRNKETKRWMISCSTQTGIDDN